MEIELVQRGNDWYATKKGEPTKRGTGITSEAAIGDLISKYPTEFNIIILKPVQVH